MKKKNKDSSRHDTVRGNIFDFHPDRIMLDADEYREAIEWIGNEITYYSEYDSVTEDKTFLPWFECIAKSKLHSAGFKWKRLEDKKELEKTINVLNYQGTISPDCGRIPLQNGFPPKTFSISEDDLTFRINTQIDATLRTLKSIASIKQLLVKDGVVNKEAMKVYLHTIELMINQMKAGYLGRLAALQIKIIEKGAEGGKKSGKVRQTKAKSIHDTWQDEAEKFWKKHPAWGKPAVAKKIAEKIGGNPETIRKSIKKTPS